jgi:hypothetical protein
MDGPDSGASSIVSRNLASAREVSSVRLVSVGVYAGSVSVLVPATPSDVLAGGLPIFICRPPTIPNMTLFSLFLGFLG